MLAWPLKTGGYPMSHYSKWNENGRNEAAPTTDWPQCSLLRQLDAQRKYKRDPP